MVNVEISNGKHCYMDNRLHLCLTKAKNRIKKDSDRVFLIDGMERSGKSVFAQQVACTFDPSFTHERMCFTEEEFAHWIDVAEKGQVVVYDEAYRGLSSGKWADKVSKLLISKMMEMGQKNLIVIIVCPNFFMLQKYIVLHRSWGLFHVYTKGDTRGFWAYFNRHSKQLLYLKGQKTLSYNGKGFPRATLIGRFFDQYLIDEELYRKKKAESYQNFGLEINNEKPKYNKTKSMRDALIYKFYQENGKNAEKCSKLLKDQDIDIDGQTILNIVHAREDKSKV